MTLDFKYFCTYIKKNKQINIRKKKYIFVYYAIKWLKRRGIKQTIIR